MRVSSFSAREGDVWKGESVRTQLSCFHYSIQRWRFGESFPFEKKIQKKYKNICVFLLPTGWPFFVGFHVDLLFYTYVRDSRESPFDFCQMEIEWSAVAYVGTCHFLFDETEEKLNWTKIKWFLSCFSAFYSIRFFIKLEWLSVKFQKWLAILMFF